MYILYFPQMSGLIIGIKNTLASWYEILLRERFVRKLEYKSSIVFCICVKFFPSAWYKYFKILVLKGVLSFMLSIPGMGISKIKCCSMCLYFCQGRGTCHSRLYCLPPRPVAGMAAEYYVPWQTLPRDSSVKIVESKEIASESWVPLLELVYC